jgi:hypothetical protein
VQKVASLVAQALTCRQETIGTDESAALVTCIAFGLVACSYTVRHGR